MKNEVRRSILLDAAKKIKSLGFRVFVVDDPNDEGRAWGYFHNGNTVAYFQCDAFGFISISTHHRPCLHGTGFVVRKELLVSEITKDICKEAFSLCPNWYSGPVKGVQKYTPREFFKEEREKWNKTYTEIL